MTVKEIERLSHEYHDEYLVFDKIPIEERRHALPDLCAMIFLHEKFGGSVNAVSAASHDEIWLNWDYDKIKKTITDNDILYLIRCGVRFDDGLVMFV